MSVLERRSQHPGCMHACPLTTFSHSAPTFSFELLYPCGCSHPLSSHRCATTFLAQMSTDKAEEKRARSRNMAAITNRKTSGEGGSVSWLLLRGNGNTGGSTWVRGASPRAFAARAQNKLAVESEDSASIMQQSKDREAETAQRLKWGSQIVEGIKGEGGANITFAPLGSTEEIVWRFFFILNSWP